MRKLLHCTIVSLAALLLTNCVSNMKIKTLPYPVTGKGTTVDNYHGTEVADPYRWLEDDNSDATAEWVAAQNEVTFDYLSQIPYRQDIRERLSSLYNYEQTGAPVKKGDYYFWFRNDGLQNQSVLYMSKSLDDKNPQVFLDPNTLSSDGTVALSAISYSDDGRYLAYAVSESGSDWVDIYVKDIPSGNIHAESIKWGKFPAISWGTDSKGFYYSRYDEPAQGEELSGVNQYQKVYYHTIGTPQKQDKLIYSDSKHPLRYFKGSDDRDAGRWEFISISEGTHGTELVYRKKGSAGGFKTLFKGFKYDYRIVNCIGDTAYVLTNQDAPNYRLVKVNLNAPTKGQADIIAERKDFPLETVTFAGGHLFASYLENAVSKVYQYTTEGNLVRQVELPTLGTAMGFSAKDDDKETFYTLSNFITPMTVYRYDIATGESTPFTSAKLAYDPDKFVAEQIFFTSKDGTQVPMFVIHRKDIKLDGSNPLYLYGYGGFNVSLTPGFSPFRIALVEQGGVYVMVNLRGGGEYGAEWHQAGMLANKQNVFDDFIAAAEYLIDKGYTSKQKLAIAGGSNGGLLVGACMTQRPDLFTVAFPAVGVMDMLRYHLFTVGWGWVVEYGSSDNAEQFEYIYKYSPLHNLHKGTCYPATMVTTADHDDRVVPAHSFKFAAALQEAQGCDNPALIRIETNAGHGAGKPVSKRIDEDADIMSFMLWNTNTKYKTQK